MTGDILKKNVRLFIMRSFILSVYQGIYDVIFNLYILDLGFHEDFLGLMLSVNLLASSMSSVPAGVLCDRYNKRKMMVAFSFLSFLSVVPLFLTGSPLILLFFSAVGGVCGSVGAVCATPFLTENCDRDTVRIFSLNSAFSWMASVIGCTVGGVLPRLLLRFAIADTYCLTMLISLVLLLAGWSILLLMKDGRARPSAKNKKPLNIKFSHNLLKFTLISALTGVGTGAIVPYFNVYFTRVLGATSSEIGIVVSVSTYLGGLSMARGDYLLPYGVTCVAYLLAAGLMYYLFKDAGRPYVERPRVADRGRGRAPDNIPPPQSTQG